MNSRDKGKRGELELAHVLREAGFEDARRGQQYSGANGDADVVGLPGIHLEVKRVEKLNIENAMVQSECDALDNEIPVVVHRRNYEDWKVTMRLDTFLDFYKAVDDSGLHWDSGRVRIADEERIMALVGDGDRFDRIMEIIYEGTE